MSRTRTALAGVVVLFLLMILACGGTGSPSPKGQPSTTPTEQQNEGEPIVDPALQPDREKLLGKLIARGIFRKVEVPGTLPHVWVGPEFYALEFELKQKFVSVVSAYYVVQSETFDPVVLYDVHSGKQVGTFSGDYGLRMD